MISSKKQEQGVGGDTMSQCYSGGTFYTVPLPVPEVPGSVSASKWHVHSKLATRLLSCRGNHQQEDAGGVL